MTKKENKELKILFLDIETSYAEVAVFSLFTTYVNPSNVLREPIITHVGYKFLNKKGAVISISKSQLKSWDDYIVLKRAHKVMQEADIIVAHNGNKFDRVWINGQFIKHKLPPMPFKIWVDTRLFLKGNSRYLSNKLDFVTKSFFKEGKSKTENEWWLSILRREYTFIKVMAKYCLRDVVILEKLFKRLAPYWFNFPQLKGRDSHCPICSSKKVSVVGEIRSKSSVWQKLQCLSCLLVYKGKTINNKNKR